MANLEMVHSGQLAQKWAIYGNATDSDKNCLSKKKLAHFSTPYYYAVSGSYRLVNLTLI